MVAMAGRHVQKSALLILMSHAPTSMAWWIRLRPSSLETNNGGRKAALIATRPFQLLPNPKINQKFRA